MNLIQKTLPRNTIEMYRSEDVIHLGLVSPPIAQHRAGRARAATRFAAEGERDPWRVIETNLWKRPV